MRFFRASARRMISLRLVGAPLAAVGLYSTQCTSCDAPPAPEEEMPTLMQQAEEERKKAKKLKNPGLYERMMDEGRRIAHVDVYEGLRLEVQKMVTPSFYFGHTLMLGHNIPNQPANALYDLSTHVVPPNGMFMMAHMGAGGGIDGRLHVPGPGNITTKLMASLSPQAQRDSFTLEQEIAGEDFSIMWRINKERQLMANYLQAITPHLSLGGESIYDIAQKVGVLGLAAKYSVDDWVLTGQVQHGGQVMAVQYLRHVSPNRMTLVADFMVQLASMEAVSLLALEVNMKQSRFVTAVDSEGRVASSLEARVIPNAMSLTLTGEVAPHKNHYKFGYGVQLNV